jgi:transketolase
VTQKKTKQFKATRDAFGEAILGLGEKNPDITVISADLNASTRVTEFAKKFPERFIQVGVAEQNMASVATGMALAGKIPFMTSFGVFSPGKNWDQIRIGICYNKANVKIVSTHTGLTVGKDGATHQSLEDIALTRVLPNMTVLSPIDAEETKEVVKKAVLIKGPVYIRLTRAKTPLLKNLTKTSNKFKLGKVNVLEKGEKVALVGTGVITLEGLQAAQEINAKYPDSVRVINAPTIKPINEKSLFKALKGIKKVVTLEEHQIAGGFGSAVCEILSEKGLRNPRKITRMGMQDSFGESGSYKNLKKKYKLNKESIREKLLEELGT